MGWDDLVLRLRALFGGKRIENELDEELNFHLEMQARKHRAAGFEEAAAGRQARVEFGGVERVREECRDARGVSFLGDLARDARYGLRMLRKSPAFAAVAILSLGIGIGANTAVFTLIDAVLFRMLPVKNPEQLMVMHWGARKDLDVNCAYASYNGGGRLGWTRDVVSWPVFTEMRKRTRTLDGLIGFSPLDDLSVVARGQAFVTGGMVISGNYFQTLGASTLLGRPIQSDDDTADGTPAAVISYRMWERVFDLDPSVIGKTILVNGQQCVIVGVTSRNFVGVSPGGFNWVKQVDVVMPIRARDRMAGAGGPRLSWFGDLFWIQTMGRVKPGVNLGAVRGELASILSVNLPEGAQHALGAEVPRIELIPGSRGLSNLRDAYRNPLLILLGTVGLTLLMACANLAGLLLARATARQKEIMVRLAMGARRGRLVRQLLIEGALLAAGGAIAGALFAWWGVRALVALVATGRVPILVELGPDVRVLAFTAAISIAATFLFALAPAIRATHVDVVSGLKEDTPTTAGGRRLGFVQLLVSAQVAVAVLLVVGAALFSRSLANLRSVPLGFNADHLVVFDLAPGTNGYNETRGNQFYAKVLERLKQTRGVVSASLARLRVMADSVSNGAVIPEGGSSGKYAYSLFNFVGPDYFRVMQIPVVLGRPIEQRDMAAAPGVAVVNETFARTYFGGGSPLGRRFRWKKNDKLFVEVVGVVKDALYAGLRSEPQATVYAPYTQLPWGWPQSMSFAVRTVIGPAEAVAGVRRAVRDVDGMVPVIEPKTMQSQIGEGLYKERLFASLISLFGAITLVLACAGLYGMVSYSVARRTREIGVRVTLGAGRATVLRMVLGQVWGITIAGLAVGVPATLALGRLVQHHLFGVKANDPWSLCVSAAIIVVMAQAAVLVPVWRALHIDLVSALRYE